jgi:replication factor C subunit 3/5
VDEQTIYLPLSVRFRFGPIPESQVIGRLSAIAAKENLLATRDGIAAVIKIAHGDMRKCLNIMQACQMAYDKVDLDSVYMCTGYPHPKDVAVISDALFNKSFEAAYKTVVVIQTTKGLSLTDIVVHLHEQVLRISLPPKALCFLVDRLSDLEYRLSFGTNEKVQLSALVGIFALVKEMCVLTGQHGY